MTTTNEELVEEFKKAIGYQTVGTHVLPPLQNGDVVVGALMVALATKDAACEERMREERGNVIDEAVLVLEEHKDNKKVYQGEMMGMLDRLKLFRDQLTDKE